MISVPAVDDRIDGAICIFQVIGITVMTWLEMSVCLIHSKEK